MIKVVRGNPTPEELAAALAVVQARAAATAAASAEGGGLAVPEGWSDPPASHGRAAAPGSAGLGAVVLARLKVVRARRTSGPEGRTPCAGVRPSARVSGDTRPVEYPYSGAAALPGRRIGGMLWSDPENEPPKFMREMQTMLRRAGVLLALAMVVAMFAVGVR